MKQYNDVNRALGDIDEILKKRINKEERKRMTQRLLFLCAAVGAITYILVAVIFEIEIVQGDSMKKTLSDGQMAVSYRLESEYQYRDIVLLKNERGTDYIKRIIGVPGDTIDIDKESGKIIRNNKELSESYAFGKTFPKEGGLNFPVMLGEDEYILIGDNREDSSDSRSWGIVLKAQLKGKIILP